MKIKDWVEISQTEGIKIDGDRRERGEAFINALLDAISERIGSLKIHVGSGIAGVYGAAETEHVKLIAIELDDNDIHIFMPDEAEMMATTLENNGMEIPDAIKKFWNDLVDGLRTAATVARAQPGVQ